MSLTVVVYYPNDGELSKQTIRTIDKPEIVDGILVVVSRNATTYFRNWSFCQVMNR